MPNHQRCLICDLAVCSFQDAIQDDLYIVSCYRCGSYRIKQSDSISLNNHFVDKRKRTNLSGWIRENQPNIKIKYDDFEKLSNLRTPPVGERATKLLLYIEKLLPSLNATLPSNHINNNIQALEHPNFPKVSGFDQDEAKKLVPMLSISWSLNWNELEYLIRKYLWDTKKYIDISGNNNIMITPEGWAFLESLRYGNPDSQIGFIAMWFDPSMKELFDNISDAIIDSGYEPKRIDQHEHVNRIDDEIIAIIRQSKFIVADYTGQRGGVYFESGFALGLGLRVVWLCREDDKDNLHFDTNHYNFIFWEPDKLDLLRESLKKRIIAILGKGSKLEIT